MAAPPIEEVRAFVRRTCPLGPDGNFVPGKTLIASLADAPGGIYFVAGSVYSWAELMAPPGLAPLELYERLDAAGSEPAAGRGVYRSVGTIGAPAAPAAGPLALRTTSDLMTGDLAGTIESVRTMVGRNCFRDPGGEYTPDSDLIDSLAGTPFGVYFVDSGIFSWAELLAAYPLAELGQEPHEIFERLDCAAAGEPRGAGVYRSGEGWADLKTAFGLIKSMRRFGAQGFQALLGATSLALGGAPTPALGGAAQFALGAPPKFP